MSLAARCPWCETVFRLTEGQVSAKGGMARCGVCNHTFNALDALLSDSAVAALERGAQAREANQEATARAIEQSAARSADAMSIPLSIRKMLSGTNPPPAEGASTPSAPSGPPASGPVQFKIQPSPQPAMTPSAQVTASPATSLPIALPAALPVAVPVALPVASLVASLPIALPAVSPDTVKPDQGAEQDPNISADHATGVAEDRAAQAPTSAPVPKAPPVPARAPMSVFEPKVAALEPAPADQAIPIDYKVEMPNYDAERAAALADAEHQQREQQESHARSADVTAQIDEIQSALSPEPSVDEDGLEGPEESSASGDKPAVSATLSALRLQHAEVQAASKSDLLREEERLGPNTFQPSFLKSSEPSGAWRRTRRLFGALLVLVLLFALAAQSIYWWRGDLALRVPQIKPYLVQACQRLHCDVDPPTQIDQLSIESSELVTAPGGGGALSFTALVRNHSVNALAYPAIEITLTDARDQAVLRRVFQPESYLADPLGTKKRAGLPGNSEYTLKLTFNTSGVATSGYRAGIFYP